MVRLGLAREEEPLHALGSGLVGNEDDQIALCELSLGGGEACLRPPPQGHRQCAGGQRQLTQAPACEARVPRDARFHESMHYTRCAFLGTAAATLGALLMPARSSGGAMLERRIPKSGEAVPAVGLGTWQVFDVEGDSARTAQAKATLKAFVELGGRVIDRSPM